MSRTHDGQGDDAGADDDVEDDVDDERTAALVDDVLRAVNSSSSSSSSTVATKKQLGASQHTSFGSPLPLLALFSAAGYHLGDVLDQYRRDRRHRSHHHRRSDGNTTITTSTSSSTGAVHAPALALAMDLPGVMGHEDIKVLN